MKKFCGICGARLNKDTGECPNCNRKETYARMDAFHSLSSGENDDERDQRDDQPLKPLSQKKDFCRKDTTIIENISDTAEKKDPGFIETGRRYGLQKYEIRILTVAAGAVLFLMVATAFLHGQLRSNLNQILKSFCAGDRSAAQTYFLGDYDRMRGNGKSADEIAEKITYEVTNISILGKQGKATVKLQTPDMVQILKEVQPAAGDNPDRLADLVNRRLSQEFPIQKFEVPVYMDKIGDHWYLLPNENLSNAISGGLIKERSRLEFQWIYELMENEK